MALPRVDIDTVESMTRWQATIRGLISNDVVEYGASKFMTDFHATYTGSVSAIGQKLTELAHDDGETLVDIADRMKYIVADLEILKACAKAAAIADGRCVEVGLDCMSFVMSQMSVLTKIERVMRTAH